MIHFTTQLRENIWFALSALANNKIRSFLTMFGILLGVTAIIIIFTAIQSINDYVEGEFANLGSSTLYLSKFSWEQDENHWEIRNRPTIKMDDYKQLEEHIRTADYMTPIIEAMRVVAYRNKNLPQVYTVGCNEQYVETNDSETQAGRFFTEMEVYRANPVCVIGENVWEELFDKTDALGKRIKINGFPCKVIGILEKKGNFFGFNMDNQVIIPYTTFRGISINRRGISVAFRAAPSSLEELTEEIRGVMRRIRKLSPEEKDNFSINQQTMLTDLYKRITGTSYLVIFIIGGISLIVGGIGIMNIMLVSVTERTKEIGIRKALGATRRNILMQFLSEAITLSAIGGVIGIFLGVGVGELILQKINLGASISVLTIIIGFGFSSLVGVISGIYPAYKAGLLNPIDALRYE